MSANTQNKDEGPILLDFLQAIKDKRQDPRLLDKNVKVDLTGVLYLDGYTGHQIAQIFKLSDRTIKRYLKEIKRRNAVKKDPKFSDRFVGDLIIRVNHNYNSLIRHAQSKEAKAFEKIQAISAANQSLFAQARLLQSIGYVDSLQKNPQPEPSSRDVTVIAPAINILPVSAEPKKWIEDVKPN